MSEIPDVVWEDPPPAPTHRSPAHFRKEVLDKFRDELRAHCGKWAVYPEEGRKNPFTRLSAKACMRAIVKGVGPWAPEPGYAWEARAAELKLYVRLVKEEPSCASPE